MHRSSKPLTTNELWLLELQIKIVPVYWPPYPMHYGICANCLLQNIQCTVGYSVTFRTLALWPFKIIFLNYIFVNHSNNVANKMFKKIVTIYCEIFLFSAGWIIVRINKYIISHNALYILQFRLAYCNGQCPRIKPKPSFGQNVFVGIMFLKF